LIKERRVFFCFGFLEEKKKFGIKTLIVTKVVLDEEKWRE
jgi:hypothetical protein